MDKQLYYRIAKQIFLRISARLPNIPLPDQIEKEALNCYFDFVNNDGKMGLKQYNKMLTKFNKN